MMNLAEGKRQLEILETRVKSAQHELRQRERERPQHALKFEQGDKGPLEKFDAEVKARREAIERTEDAILQLRRDIKLAAEAEVSGMLAGALDAWRNVRRGLSLLLTGLAQYDAASKAIHTRAAELHVTRFSLPDPDLALYQALAKVVPQPTVSSSQGYPTLHEQELEIEDAIAELKRRSSNLMAKKPAPARREDQATGTLGALSASAPPRA